MKKLTLIIAICLIPLSALALDKMQDKELDNVHAKFGTSAIGDTSALTAPATDTSGNAQNFTPAVQPASVVYDVYGEASARYGEGSEVYSRYGEGSQVQGLAGDAGMTTKIVTDSRNTIAAASLGFF